MYISTSIEVAHAVLGDTLQAYEQGISAEEKAEQHIFASEQLKSDYIEGFHLSIEFIQSYREFAQRPPQITVDEVQEEEQKKDGQ